MAKLNPSLIFSMTRELSELHEIGQEMLEHFGPCKIVSWRFPGCLINNVEIDIEHKLFDDSEKYVHLLELIIDRLYLIINLTVEMLNSLPNLSNNAIIRLPKNVSKPMGISFGTLIAMLWKRLQILAGSKCSQFSTSTSLSSLNNSEIPENCQSCEIAMKTIKKLINNIEDYAKTLKLDSELIKTRKNKIKFAMNLTQNDAMETWTSCILTDIELMAKVAQNKTRESEYLYENLEQVKNEVTGKEKEIILSENKISELEKMYSNLNLQLKTVTQEKQGLVANLDKLSTNIKQLEEENSTKNNEINKLEDKINQTMIENENSRQKFSAEFIKQITTLKHEIDYWTNLNDVNNTEIQSLQMKLKNEHQKYKQFEIEQQEIFDKEKQKILQEKLKIEEENKKFTSELQDLQNQMDQKECDFLTKINLLENEKMKLQDQIKLGNEREAILIKCPDLNGPIEYDKKNQNPLEDMEEQMISNEVRIHMLQEQNKKLHNTVKKLKQLRNK